MENIIIHGLISCILTILASIGTYFVTVQILRKDQNFYSELQRIPKYLTLLFTIGICLLAMILSKFNYYIFQEIHWGYSLEVNDPIFFLTIYSIGTYNWLKNMVQNGKIGINIVKKFTLIYSISITVLSYLILLLSNRIL